VGRSAGPEAIRAFVKVLLVDRLQYHDDRTLEQFIFQRGDDGGILHLLQCALGIVDTKSYRGSIREDSRTHFSSSWDFGLSIVIQ